MTQVKHWDTRQYGELDEEKLRRQLEQRGYFVNCYIYPPGTCFPDHSHSVDKIDAVLSGQFRMQMQGVSVVLGAGDWLEVPKDVVHSAQVLGNESVVSLDAIRIE